MRTLYLDQTGQLGGGEIALLPWLVQQRAEASVLLFEDGPFRELLETHGVAVQVLSGDGDGLGVKAVRRESGMAAILSSLPSLWALRQRVAAVAGGFDVLYANSQKAFFVAALARRRGQPLVWHLRDILTADHFSPALRRAAVLLGNRAATLIVVNSEATAEAWRAAGGRADRVVVVHDGVGAAPFDAPEVVDPERRTTLRQEIAPGASQVVGVFGRLTPWKGQHVLLEALAGLGRPEVHAVLVGDALFGEQAYAEDLRQRCRLADLAGRVHFLGFRSDVPALMRAVDIVAHTSIAPEPFGLVLVEGMLAERPVIATAAGGAREVLGEPPTGVLVPPGDAAALREALLLLCDQPEVAARLARAGRQRAERVFSLEAVFAGIAAALDSLEHT